MTKAFRNPVVSDNDGQDHGDPFVLKYLETYYLYHTGRKGIHLYASLDLVNWEYLGMALVASELPFHWAQTDLWAPEVFYHHGTFYMYVAGTRMTVDGRGDDVLRRQGLARSETPTGPFVWDEKPLVDEWSIDGHPFQDSDGSLWLYYNIRTDATRYHDGTTGCGNVVQQLGESDRLVGEQIPVTFPSERWEGNSDGTWYWNEGPCVLKRRATYYQMYSGGWFADGTYSVGFATAPSHRGPWTKYAGNPILRSTGTVLGPGHHCITHAPDGVTPYAIYHAYIPRLPGRKVYIDRLYWAGDRPVLAGPTSHEQPYPPQAVYERSIPHWHLSAWVQGGEIVIAGHTLSLPTPNFHLVEATRQGDALQVAVDGITQARYSSTDMTPELVAEAEVRGFTLTSHLDDEMLHTLGPNSTQRWAWSGTGRVEVSLAVQGTATVHARGRDDREIRVASPHRYKLVQLSLEHGMDVLEVAAEGDVVHVTDVVITARQD